MELWRNVYILLAGQLRIKCLYIRQIPKSLTHDYILINIIPLPIGNDYMSILINNHIDNLIYLKGKNISIR